MALRREHELHARRRSRNIGLGVVLVLMVAMVFFLTVVKVTVLDPARNGTAHAGNTPALANESPAEAAAAPATEITQ